MAFGLMVSEDVALLLMALLSVLGKALHTSAVEAMLCAAPRMGVLPT